MGPRPFATDFFARLSIPGPLVRHRGMRPLYEQPQMAVLFDSTCRAAFERVARSPCGAEDLARTLGVPRAEACRCLAELVGAGLVRLLPGERYAIAASGLASIRREIENAWVRRLAAAFTRSLAIAEPG